MPPVDELDLVGPFQVFNSVNRLAGRNIYGMEVVANADRLTVEGVGGVLTFVAKHHFSKVEGACDSVLVVCGLGTRSVRDATLSACLKKMAAEARRLGAVCVGAFLLAEAGLLNGRTGNGRLFSAGPCPARSALGQRRKYLHLGWHFCRHGSGSGLGERGLRRRSGA